ncbi:MAG TPA: hypothetical protein VGJ15_06180, partial [Pirellulales bacterium]
TRVEQCKTVKGVADFLAQSPNAFVVTTDEHYAKLAARLPGGVVVAARVHNFPHNGDVIVLHRQDELAQRDDGAKK